MTIKEWLKSFRRLTRKVELMQATIDKIQAQIGKGPQSDGLPRGSGLSDQTGRLASQLADAKIRQSRILAEAIDRAAEIQDAIFRVEDVIYMTLLYDRYILLKPWTDITDDLNMRNEQYVRGKLHSIALHEIEEVLTENERRHIEELTGKGEAAKEGPDREPDAGEVSGPAAAGDVPV